MQEPKNPTFICKIQDSDQSDNQVDHKKQTIQPETQISQKSHTIHHNTIDQNQRQKQQINKSNIQIKQLIPEKIAVSSRRKRNFGTFDKNQQRQLRSSGNYKETDRKLLGSNDSQKQQYKDQPQDDVQFYNTNNIKNQETKYHFEKNLMKQYQMQYEEQIIQKISNNSQKSYESDSQEIQQEEQQEEQYDQYEKSPQKISSQKKQTQKFKSQPSAQLKIKQNPILIQDQFDKVISSILPIGYKIVCTITIQSRFLGLSSKYNLNLKQNGTQNQYRFILSAKKQILKLNSNYIISKSYGTKSINKRNNNYIGLLYANFTGTQFILHSPNTEVSSLIINYGKNLMGYNGVRQIIVLKPKPGIQQSPQNQLNNLLLRKQLNKIERLETVKPTKTKAGWKIDFKGKAKEASDRKQRQSLLFAKQNDDTYLMEVTYPFSISEGFAICLSSLDSKLLCN